MKEKSQVVESLFLDIYFHSTRWTSTAPRNPLFYHYKFIDKGNCKTYRAKRVIV